MVETLELDKDWHLPYAETFDILSFGWIWSSFSISHPCESSNHCFMTFRNMSFTLHFISNHVHCLLTSSSGMGISINVLWVSVATPHCLQTCFKSWSILHTLSFDNCTDIIWATCCLSLNAWISWDFQSTVYNLKLSIFIPYVTFCSVFSGINIHFTVISLHFKMPIKPLPFSTIPSSYNFKFQVPFICYWYGLSRLAHPLLLTSP